MIVTAGALATPRLLMVSGVGDAKVLDRMGIDVVADIPAVGKFVQVRMKYTCMNGFLVTYPIAWFWQGKLDIISFFFNEFNEI